MTRLEEIIAKERERASGETSEPQARMAVDEALKDEDKSLVEEAKRTRLEEIVANRKKRIAEAHRDTGKIQENLPNFTPGVSVSANTTAAILKTLVDSGMDGAKANLFIKELDQETLAKMAIISGNKSGTDVLLPLIMLGKGQSTSAKDLAEIGRSYIDVVNETLANTGQAPSSLELVSTMVMLAKEMRPQQQQDPNNALGTKIDALVEHMHDRELEFQKTIASLKEGQLQGELGGIRAQLAALQSRNLGQELDSAKALFEKLGMEVTRPGAGKEELNVEKVIETIMKSPAVDKLASATGDAIRSRTAGGGIRARSPNPEGNIEWACDTCLGRGVTTPLRATAEQLAGTGVTCPVCGTNFHKQAK